jgi:hypothetical protein
MFERYTESARRTLFFARYEASQTGSRAIETEHVVSSAIVVLQAGRINSRTGPGKMSSCVLPSW